MKFTLLTICLFLSSNLLYGQAFLIIKVAGTITTIKEGDTLRRGTIIISRDSLSFQNSEDRRAVAAIIDIGSRARYIIRSKDSSPGIYEGPIDDYLIRSRTRTGTRHGKLNTIFDIRTFLGDGDFMILGGELVLEINPDNLAMNADSFFYVSYQYNSQTVNKKLQYHDDKLILNKSEIFKVKNVPIPNNEASEFKLYYYRKNIGERELVTSFHPDFLPDAEVTEELNVIRNAIESYVDTSELRKEMVAFLIEFYGRGDEDNLKVWLDNYLTE